MEKMITRTLLRPAVFGVLILSAPMAATAQPQPQPQPQTQTQTPGKVAPSPLLNTPQATAVDSSYLLGPGDVVEIGLVGRADFGSRARVSTDGTIQLPMIGSVQAAQRT